MEQLPRYRKQIQTSGTLPDSRQSLATAKDTSDRQRFAGAFFNHVNFNAIDNPSFGQITAARGSDFGGYRTGQISARIDF